MNQWESEEKAIVDAYNAGVMTLAEYNKAMQQLQREYRWSAQEAAHEAYEREMDRW